MRGVLVACLATVALLPACRSTDTPEELPDASEQGRPEPTDGGLSGAVLAEIPLPHAQLRPVSPGCRPQTCQSLGAQCDEHPDGCGGWLWCGACPEGEACGTGGVPHVCAPCQPSACAALNVRCGGASDGCGGWLECGSCPEDQHCRASSEGKACAAHTAPRWSVVWSTAVHEAAFGADGTLFAMGADGDALLVARFDATGALMWERRFVGAAPGGQSLGRSGRMKVVPPGVYVAFGSISEGGTIEGRPFVGSALLKLDFHGQLLWVEDLAGRTEDLAATTTQVAVIRRERSSPSAEVLTFDADGTRRGVLPVNGARALAFHPDGSMIVGGAVPPASYPAPFSLPAQAGRGFFGRLLGDGSVSWVHVVGDDAEVTSLGTTAQGTVVALVRLREGSLTWAGQTTWQRGFDAQTALLVAEANGAERWLRSYPFALGGAVLDVTPGGRLALGLNSESCAAVLAIDLAGTVLWTDRPVTGECDEVRALTVAATEDQLVVGGVFSHPNDFGAGPVEPVWPFGGYLRAFGK
jgi:hypothetical protein